jgi:hypothetical protein
MPGGGSFCGRRPPWATARPSPWAPWCGDAEPSRGVDHHDSGNPGAHDVTW